MTVPSHGDPLDERFLAIVREFMETLVPFNRVLGLKLTDARRGVVRAELAFREDLIGDPIKRALHGGVLSAFADAVGGCAVFTVLEPGSRCSTIDLRIDYLRPGKPETVHAEGTVLRLGGRVAVASVAVHQADREAPVAVAMAVYAVRRA
ncbi:thioesterase family protein [bacterium]|nr:thioesterase family protein [bacterium]